MPVIYVRRSVPRPVVSLRFWRGMRVALLFCFILFALVGALLVWLT